MLSSTRIWRVTSRREISCRHPGQYKIVRQVLGHKDIKTTITFYAGDEGEAAAEHFDRTVLRDRQALRLVAAQAFKKGAGGPANRGRRSRK